MCHQNDIFPLMMKNASGQREENEQLPRTRSGLVGREPTAAAAAAAGLQLGEWEGSDGQADKHCRYLTWKRRAPADGSLWARQCP